MGSKHLDPARSRYQRDFLAWRKGYIEWVFEHPSVKNTDDAAAFMGVSTNYLYQLCRDSGIAIRKIKKERKKHERRKKAH